MVSTADLSRQREQLISAVNKKFSNIVSPDILSVAEAVIDEMVKADNITRSIYLAEDNSISFFWGRSKNMMTVDVRDAGIYIHTVDLDSSSFLEERLPHEEINMLSPWLLDKNSQQKQPIGA